MPTELKENPFRYHAMDRLRSFAMLLGVVIHAFLPYSTFPLVGWPVADPCQHVFFETGILIIHSFRMELFFFISGFFSIYLYQKSGLILFVKNRFRRILIPFLCAWPVTFIALMFIPKQSVVLLKETPIFHLWFLYYLLIFYGFLSLFLFSNRLFKIKGQALTEIITRLVNSPFHLIPFVLCTLPCLFLMKKTIIDTQLNFQIEQHLIGYYSIFFFFGCIFYQQPILFTVFKKYAKIYLLIALFTFSLLFFNFQTLGLYPEKMTPLLALTRISQAFCTWALVLFFIGFFQRNNEPSSRIVRYLSEASYWIFLLHLPVVIYFHTVLLDCSVPISLKPLIVFSLTLMVLLGSYEMFRQFKALTRQQPCLVQ
jgi:glucan biosynthesis protein C